MQTWYYSTNGEQRGPVSLDELRRQISASELNLHSDLAWTEGMTDWQPVGKIPELIQSSAPASAPGSPEGFNPYAAPATAADNLLAPRSGDNLAEIEPGSVPLEVMNCIKRGVDLTKRHFGTLVVIGIVYLIISVVLGAAEELANMMLTGAAFGESEGAFHPLMIPIKLISSIITVVLAAGLTRASLNVCSGREASVGDLFAETGKLVNIIAGSVLFYLMLIVGFLLLVVPGIYVGLRFSYFVTAIVDRNLGPIEALKYSYRITTNNALSLFGLGALSVLIVLAGALALLVGLFFALPVVTLAYTLAYRFLQFGPEALRDTPAFASR